MVYLIRHTTPGIAADLCYGRTDVPLAASATAEIADAVTLMPKVTRIYVSPATRCRLLAEALARRDEVTPIVDARLQELDMGAWENRRWSDVSREAVDAWAADLWSARPGGGEALSELWERVASCRQEILEFAPQESVAIVSHHGPLRAWICLHRDLPHTDLLNLKIAYGAAGIVTLD
jgi:alpha-ribazole phosphatase